jgi:hypothetical protein
MGKPITGHEFGDLLRAFERTAFRLETRRQYNEPYEQADLKLFLAGAPRQPDEIDWFRPWLDQIRQQTRQGKQISRVRVHDKPPTGYQRWERWLGAWNIAAGEDIRYMARTRAAKIGLPLDHDWWLLDGSQVIVMCFDSAGDLASRELLTDPLIAGEYGMWQDLAVRNAEPLERITAA